MYYTTRLFEKKSDNIMQEIGNKQQPRYVPPELVICSSNARMLRYYCYLIELKPDYDSHIRVHDIVLALRTKLDPEISRTQFGMCVERGNLHVSLRQVNLIRLSTHQVENCRRFQNTLFRILLDGKVDMSASVGDEFRFGDDPEIDYLLLPATAEHHGSSSKKIIDWKSIFSVPFICENTCECSVHVHDVWTKNGLVCSCKLKNCVVTTPHNVDSVYIITGIMNLNGNSAQRGKRAPTYKEYYKDKYGIQLKFEQQPLLNGRHVFKMNNYLLSPRQKRKKGLSMSSVELPPELCYVIMSPISISTIYSFTFIPSIMHRLESLLIAFNLKKMLLDHCTMKNDIPTIKVLQAITTKGCQERFDYNSLETLGDSFLKYATSQQLFKTNQSHREGSLTDERKEIISNVVLSKFGCRHRLPGFIRQGTFDPKQWIIPGDKSKCPQLKEQMVSSRTSVYVCGSREMDPDDVADVVEALIGVFISIGDEEAALSFMNWIGIKVDTNIIPYESKLSIPPEKLVDVTLLESILNNYSFHDPSLLVEALTHGSFKRPEVPTCYQRLEFLGDAVLDYLFTLYFYKEYPEESSEFLNDMRSISANNDCYALSAIKSKLHEHILRNSKELDKQIAATVKEVNKLPLKSTFGWELDTSFPDVLGDVIESLAGAIFVDSGYNKEVVFKRIRPVLEPLVTPETAQLQPVKELNELCKKEHYKKKPPLVYRDNDITSVTIEVNANGLTYKSTAKASNKDTAEKLASKKVLKLMKEPNFNSVITRKEFLFPLLSAVFLFCWIANEVIYHLVYK